MFVPTSSSRKAPAASASALSQLAAMVTPGGSATGGDGGVTAGAGAGSTVGASDKGIPVSADVLLNAHGLLDDGRALRRWVRPIGRCACCVVFMCTRVPLEAHAPLPLQ